MTRPNPAAPRATKEAAVRSQFAELLAEGAHPHDAAKQMGFKPQYGRTLLAKIRRELGPQAV